MTKRVPALTRLRAVLLPACCSAALAACAVPSHRGDDATAVRDDAGVHARTLAEVAPDEELWIIADAAPPALARDERDVRSGWATAHLHTDTETVLPLPVKHLRVHATLGHKQASVDIAQSIDNPHDEPGEVIYEFNLPRDARVHEFVMIVAGRRIRGVIRSGDEAAALYRQAKRQGYRASLLTMPRPGRFTHRLSRLNPGRSLGVELQYRQPVEHDADQRRFTLPARLAWSPDPSDDATHPSVTISLLPGMKDLRLNPEAHQLVPLDATESQAGPSLRLARAADVTADNLTFQYRVSTDLAEQAHANPLPGRPDAVTTDDGLLTIDASEPADASSAD